MIDRAFVLSGAMQIRLVGWIQLLFSILLAISIIWAYTAYRSSVGEFTRSLATSILAASNVITQIADSIKARQELVDDTRHTILATRKLVAELQLSAKTQGRLLPQYASNLKYASSVTSDLAASISDVGNGLMFTVPTSVRMDGVKPILLWTRPLARQGQILKAHAQNIKTLSDSLMAFSVAMNTDAQKLNAAFIETCEQTIKLLDDTANSVLVLKKQDLPSAIADLETASENLRAASDKVKLTEDFSLALLCFGLVLAGWCAFHSIGVLFIAKSLEPIHGR